MQSAGRQIYGDNKSLQKPLKCPFEQPLDSKYLWNMQIQKQKPSIRLFATKKLQSENLITIIHKIKGRGFPHFKLKEAILRKKRFICKNIFIKRGRKGHHFMQVFQKN